MMTSEQLKEVVKIKEEARNYAFPSQIDRVYRERYTTSRVFVWFKDRSEIVVWPDGRRSYNVMWEEDEQGRWYIPMD